jgi:hypothetical protein
MIGSRSSGENPGGFCPTSGRRLGVPHFSTAPAPAAVFNRHLHGRTCSSACGGNNLEIVVDVLTKAARGQILITSYSMGDVAVRRGESFLKGTGATLS